MIERDSDIEDFEFADYLTNEGIIADYLTATAEDPNPEVFIAALADVARARGMTEVSKKASLGRESLYKALRPGSHPRHTTIKAVMAALGLKFVVVSNRKPPEAA